ncbi:MAG: hypothetical protein LAP85_05560 [Acidobacteriia bacterium]|nr:hypothetical protein [Terriglobia bacterium]
MISSFPFWRCCRLLFPVLLLTALPMPAGYKVHPWKPRAIESYPSKLTSEGITIAVDPFFSDALAAQFFDKNDMVARGIMPLAVIIFNSNNFPVEVEGNAIELLQDEDHIRTLSPAEAVHRLFATKPKAIRPPIPGIPPIKISNSNEDAVLDFRYKFLGVKRIEAHDTRGGFLYLPISNPANLRKSLADAKVYIPNIYRGDNGASMMFFEIDLKAAIDAAPRK